MPTDRVEKKRIEWDMYFLMFAHTASLKGSCDRKQVGAAIMDEHHRLISTGFNGGAAGMPDCDTHGHVMKDIGGRQSCVNTLHAEKNAVLYAHRSLRGCTIYTNTYTCLDCAQIIGTTGMIRVVYSEMYTSRNTSLVPEYFNKAGVEVTHIPVRFNFQVLCAETKCSNLARYESYRCGIHDLSFTDEH